MHNFIAAHRSLKTYNKIIKYNIVGRGALTPPQIKNGNLTKTRITSRKPATEIESGKEYFIVNAYSGHAINSCEINTPYVREAANSYSALKLKWTAESSGKENVFYLKASSFSNACNPRPPQPNSLPQLLLRYRNRLVLP